MVKTIAPRVAITALLVTLPACSRPSESNAAAPVASANMSSAPAMPAGGADAQQKQWLALATAFVQQTAQQRDLQTALQARAAGHPAYCPAATIQPKRIDIAFDPQPQFAADGTLTQGTIVYRAMMRGCAVPVLLTIYIEARPGLPLRFIAGLPGGTFADPDLQDQAIPHAVAAARPLLPGCARLNPYDTRLPGPRPDASGTLVPWSEYWLVGGCGRTVAVKVDFAPDASARRMNITADSTAARLLPPGTGAATVNDDAAPAQSAAEVPSLTPTSTAGRVLAAASGSSLVPVAGVDIPGAKVAGTCLQKLREAATTPPDRAECTAGLPPRPGAAIQCTASRGQAQAPMSVTVTNVANGSANFDCVVRGS